MCPPPGGSLPLLYFWAGAAFDGGEGRTPAERRSNFCCAGFASGNWKGDICTGLSSKSCRLPTTTTSSSPWRPCVISIHLPSVMPVCTGTDLAFALLDNEDVICPFGPLITACGGRTSAFGISRNPSDSSTKVPGRSAWSGFGRSISTNRLRVEGSSARVDRVIGPGKRRQAVPLTLTVALVCPGTIQGESSCGTLA